MSEKIRLDKLLSNMGIGSRREVKSLIKMGKVTVDGKQITAFDTLIEPHKEEVVCLGKIIEYQKRICLMMNKPSGYISATEDRNERTVMDLLDAPYSNMKLSIAGRLDKDTEGLLIITNDGKLVHNIISPKKHVNKIYEAKISEPVTSEDINTFLKGVNIGDYVTMPAQLEILNKDELSNVRVTIQEGKFHQVKRMFEAVNKKVIYLKRVQIGKLELDKKLDLGEIRILDDNEISLIFK